MDITQFTAKQLLQAIAAKQITAVAAIEAYLKQIETHDPQINALSEVFAERSLEKARLVDAGSITGPLAGVPIIVKDNICTEFGRTTCSSKILAEYRSPFNATVIDRLEAAGAIILAKANCDEFAMGSSTENSANGVTRNPWATDRVPGGSSGGSAAAVAAGFAPVALGSDTGGSIRQPAAFCGVVGLKPTYGMVSRYGLVAYGSSLDQIGPIARTVEDAAMVMNVIAGHDPMDSTSATTGYADYAADLHTPVDRLKVGIAKQYLSDDNSPAVAQALTNAIAALKDAGAEIIDIDLPHTRFGIPTYYLIATAEASSNLARYDGVHFGHRTAAPSDLIDLYAASRSEGFGEEVQRRIMLGTYALSSGYYDAYYLRALRVRRLIKNDFDAAFANCDVILCPVSTDVAFKIGENSQDPLQMYLNDIYTVNCNLAGLPGISIPYGLSDSETGEPPLPIGLQLLGALCCEVKLLRAAQMLSASAEHSEMCQL